MLRNRESWRKHPQYLADASALFGGHPRLTCRGCKKKDYELFFGHCKPCAIAKDIPRNTASPQNFHDSVNSGSLDVVKGVPSTMYPLWHWRRWFGSLDT